ncbi:MAG: Flp pilus assembly complex ATPase component TadA [Candidatus Yanofskybacteria bacterium]|nr:Flp pilus assembly complex ATPase component TadA [Candidatus Yanofskybacteria bacterium]
MASAKGTHILLIEDNALMAQLLAEKMTNLGLVPLHAASGAAGIEALTREKPTLIVIDFPLTGTPDGKATIEQIRASHPADELPILGLFSAEDTENVAKATDAGLTEHIIKTETNVDGIAARIAEIALGKAPEQSPAAPAPDASPKKKEAAAVVPAKQVDEAALVAQAQKFKEDIEKLLKMPEADVSIIQIVDSMMSYGYMARASDIHLEPYEDRLVARMRIDGILHDIFTFPKSLHSGIITRIKVLGGMRTDEHQAAQDGRFRMSVTDSEKQFDVRVSIVPTYYGENAVLRLLAEQTTIDSLDDLALTEVDRKKIRKAVQTPYGMILATGPTGSGKTTTLYTILKELNTREVQIITLEDPIEYSLEGVDQIQVNTRTGLTFAAGLRSILRQDPNVIMVGEIRDEETASIAVNAALTGHKLLATLHTNDAATTLPRLLDMGVEPFLVASTVNVAMGQRLLRMICQHCKVARRITEGEFNALKENIPAELLDDHHDFFQGKGCEVCHNSGYHGRMGIYEILEMNDFIREAVMRHADAGEIKKIAIKNGMTTLLEDGFRKAVAGLTTIEEILRVIHE